MSKVIISLVTAFALSSALALADNGLTTQTPGQKAPAFDLTDQDGKSHKLSDYHGKYLVIHWTNDQCPFIQRHYKENTFNTLANEFAGKNVSFLAIDSSNFITNDALKKTAATRSVSYPILNDSSGSVGKSYGAKSTPHVFVIDPNGVIIYEGAIDDDPYGDKDNKLNYVRAALTAAIGHQKVAVAETKPYGCSVKYKG